VTGVSSCVIVSLSCVKCEAATAFEVSKEVYGPHTAPHKGTGQCESGQVIGQVRGSVRFLTIIRTIRGVPFQ